MMQNVAPGGGCLATVSGRCRGTQLAGGQQGSPWFAPKKHQKTDDPVRCPPEPPARAGQVDLKPWVEKLDVTMVPGVTGVSMGPSPRLPPGVSKEDREERVLAMLGIVGTILNLLVIIFVYIYTTI